MFDRILNAPQQMPRPFSNKCRKCLIGVPALCSQIWTLCSKTSNERRQNSSDYIHLISLLKVNFCHSFLRLLWRWFRQTRTDKQKCKLIGNILDGYVITCHYIIWDKIFKNGISKICGKQLLKNFKGYGCFKQNIPLQMF